MEDRDIVAEIGRLTAEEHTIERAHVGAALGSNEQERLDALGVALDQCWDLLAQRRARRSAGLDPDEAHVRAPEVVEHFRQ
jgi:hypothetical protein